jgi:hypothetical protein
MEDSIIGGFPSLPPDVGVLITGKLCYKICHGVPMLYACANTVLTIEGTYWNPGRACLDYPVRAYVNLVRRDWDDATTDLTPTDTTKQLTLVKGDRLRIGFPDCYGYAFHDDNPERSQINAIEGGETLPGWPAIAGISGMCECTGDCPPCINCPDGPYCDECPADWSSLPATLTATISGVTGVCDLANGAVTLTKSGTEYVDASGKLILFCYTDFTTGQAIWNLDYTGDNHYIQFQRNRTTACDDTPVGTLESVYSDCTGFPVAVIS